MFFLYDEILFFMVVECSNGWYCMMRVILFKIIVWINFKYVWFIIVISWYYLRVWNKEFYNECKFNFFRFVKFYYLIFGKFVVDNNYYIIIDIYFI